MNYSTDQPFLYSVVREKAYEYGVIKPKLPSYILENLKTPLLYFRELEIYFMDLAGKST